jgi:1,5-anhydro-D-fructose reductase (1,5-anhydro-D-mannitol-forming)
MNIGLIGTGAMARRFLTAVEGKLTGTCFIAANSRNPERLEQFRNEYPWIECTTGLEELLGRADVDAVYISTPVHTHAALSIAAAQAGKHVLCEKPMALSVAECEAMIEAADSSGVVLQVGYMMRFHPAHRLIKRRIAEGDLGALRFAHLERTAFIDFRSPDMPDHRKWFIRPEAGGGGVLMDLGSHLIDLLLYLVGEEPESCTLQMRRDPALGVETDALAGFRFRGGLLATVFASWQVPLHDNLLQVYGDEASLVARRTLGPYTDGTVERFTPAGAESIAFAYENHYLLELEHFLECIGAGRQPVTSGRACLPTERTRERLYRNADFFTTSN